MDIYQIVAVGVISVVLVLTIKKHSPEIALLISIAASILIFIMITPKLASIFQIIHNLTSSVTSNLPYVDSVMKIIGVSYIAQFGSQICTDAGEASIASKIELAGKVIIMTISAPILMSLLNLVVNVLA